MTREEFKRRWELNDEGDGITFEDVAECAKEWGLYRTPMIHPMERVLYKVLQEAHIEGSEDYNPDND